MPLLVMVGELDRRKLELQKMLAAKDREIDDLRAQGVRASRSMALFGFSAIPL